MKLVTNSNNINALKLLVSSNVAKVSLETAYMAPSKVNDETYFMNQKISVKISPLLFCCNDIPYFRTARRPCQCWRWMVRDSLSPRLQLNTS